MHICDMRRKNFEGSMDLLVTFHVCLSDLVCSEKEGECSRQAIPLSCVRHLFHHCCVSCYTTLVLHSYNIFEYHLHRP
ncbi:hypothetical protein COCHEDRAFT_1021826 [Bipolaris maydis C5]|uniref:Uncharacterized protein n=1 Tax=Cochliobolus heterostrophus (strain C5 / ATCC 48332 / race O) TaxID=701091 RepID=M2UBL6_COCH5|nr:hypothetical protein COCHEDRAFT_1021826 [Bipolaris maydis C5]